MEAASLDFFQKMSEQELLQVIEKPVAESSWFNSLFGDVYSGNVQYIQLDELHIPTTAGFTNCRVGTPPC